MPQWMVHDWSKRLIGRKCSGEFNCSGTVPEPKNIVKPPQRPVAEIECLALEIRTSGTLPIGVAMTAFVADQPRAYRSAVAAAAAVWLLFSLGMLVNGVKTGLSLRVQVLDSVVNLVALVAASLISARTTVS